MFGVGTVRSTGGVGLDQPNDTMSTDSHLVESTVHTVVEGDALGHFERQRVHRPVHVLHELAVSALLLSLACLGYMRDNMEYR